MFHLTKTVISKCSKTENLQPIHHTVHLWRHFLLFLETCILLFHLVWHGQILICPYIIGFALWRWPICYFRVFNYIFYYGVLLSTQLLVHSSMELVTLEFTHGEWLHACTFLEAAFHVDIFHLTWFDAYFWWCVPFMSIVWYILLLLLDGGELSKGAYLPHV